jgi:hypothetical protein
MPVKSVAAEEFTELDDETELELFTLEAVLDEETATDDVALDFTELFIELFIELLIELLIELFTTLLTELFIELADKLVAEEVVSPTTP